MAPLQDECWDNNVSHSPGPELISTNAEVEVASINDNDNYSGCGDSPLRTKMMTPAFERKPESILRRAKYTITSDSIARIIPAHWPHHGQRHSVQFPVATSIVTATHTRPRTHILDIPSLYYSPQDTRRFKREYKELLRSQIGARKRMERNSRHKCEISGNNTAIESRSSRRQSQHDNSFWRSKVGRRWSGSPLASVTPCGSENQHAVILPVQSNKIDSRDSLYDGSAVLSSSLCKDGDSGEIEETNTEAVISSFSGIFSSVFDVAREAVAILNGPSSRYNYQNHQHPTLSEVNKPCITSLHLVDTLYLF